MGCFVLFEHTLWDLKLARKYKERTGMSVWTYPMGFETANADINVEVETGFEHTLWDLKLILCYWQ